MNNDLTGSCKSVSAENSFATANSIVNESGNSDLLNMAIPWSSSDICKALKITADGDLRECAFAAVSTDSRSTSKDDLFVALKGERFDGHSFVSDLIGRGVRGFVVERTFSASLKPDLQKEVARYNILLFSVDDTLNALGMLASFQRVRSNAKVLAITGSNGKTTTRKMAASIFEERFNTLSTEGNLNNEIGLPLTLLKLSVKHEWAVVEMGMNHPGEISRLSRIASPDIAIVTNTTDAHLEGLGTAEDVAKAKAEITDGMNPGSTILINRDDPRWHIIAEKVSHSPHISNTLFFGSDREQSHFSAATPLFDQESIHFTMCINGVESAADSAQPAGRPEDNKNSHEISKNRQQYCENFRVRTPAPFMLCNALAASGAAFAAGIPLNTIRNGLLKFEPAAGRMKIIEFGRCGVYNKLHLIDDTYNANPGSVKGALETLRRLSRGGESIAILGDMLELGEHSQELHLQIGHEAAVAAVSKLYGHGEMASEFLTGAHRSGLSQERTLHGTKDEIIADLLEYIQKGEKANRDIWILVKGSRGMKMEIVVEALMKLKS